MDDNDSLSVMDFMEMHGVTVAGIAMMLQIAEALEVAPGKLVLTGSIRDDALAWLAAWREAAK